MKVIDPDTQVKESQVVPDWMRSLALGREEGREPAAIETVTQTMQETLDNRFVLLRNLKLAGLDVPIPMALVGPSGVRVIYPSASPGVFRAKGDVWEYLDTRQQVYKLARPNLMMRAGLMAQAIDNYLDTNGLPIEVVEPVLVFTDPGTHVEQIRPEVRIILMDGLERFAAGLLQSPESLTSDQVEKAVEILAPDAPKDENRLGIGFERDSFSFADEPVARKKPVSPALNRVDEAVTQLNKKVPFSTRQWVLLTVLAAVNILILAAFVVLILFTS